MARLLAMDTATDACTVALRWDGETRERHEHTPRAHLQNLLPMVESLLAEAGCSLAALDAIAFGRGPGSFTGLRITIATVQGLAFGADLPAVPVSTLAALALSTMRRTGAEHVATALDARMGEVYWALYQRDGQQLRCVDAERLGRPDALGWADGAAPERCIGAGNGWRQPDAFAGVPWREFASVDAEAVPHASELAELALAPLAAGVAVAAEAVQPVYLRGADAWTKRPGPAAK